MTVTVPCGGTTVSGSSEHLPIDVSPPVPYDFDGDNTPDIVWRDASDPLTSLWITSGTSMSAIIQYSLTTTGNWHVNAIGDLDGDSYPDLVWHDTATGANVVWKWDGTQFVDPPLVIQQPSSPSLQLGIDWMLVGGGDLDGDGRADLFFRNYRNGAVSVWLMNGTTVTGIRTLPSESDLSWKIEAIGDVTLDGIPDLVWRNTSTGANSGANRVWALTRDGNRTSFNIDVDADLGWQICEIAKYNGEPTLIWRKQATNENRTWTLGNQLQPNGTFIVIVTRKTPNTPVLAPFTRLSARIVGAGDAEACAIPEVTISAQGPTTFCLPSSVKLDATMTLASGTGSFVWSTGVTGQSITVTESGSYTVTGTTEYGCSATSTPIRVTVNKAPVPTITADGALDIVKGEQRILTATPGDRYVWSTRATTQSITATTTGDYSVTVYDTNGCSATSAVAHLTARPIAPSGVVATAVPQSDGSFRVNISFVPVPGETLTYHIQRSQDGISFGPGDVSNPDAAVSPGNTYFYRVVSDNGTTRSNTSNVDIATTVAFTNDPIQARVTRLSPSHVTQLRSAIDAMRVAARLPRATWSPAAFGGTQIAEMRNRLNEALDILVSIDRSLGRPLYGDPLVVGGMKILGTHLQQMRERVK